MKKRWMIGMLFLLAVLVGCSAATKNKTGEQEKSDAVLEDRKNELFEPVEEKVLDVSEINSITEKYVKEENTDAAELAKYNAVNRMFTWDSATSQQSLFCIDPDTGVVYFVNQNKDWYIYRLKDGKAELAVELPARELYMWNGTLYFIVEDYDKYELVGASEKNIYAYTPADGSVTLVYTVEEMEKASESHLGVDEEGLYLFYSIPGEAITVNGATGYKTESYYYAIPFGSSELVEDPYKKAIAGWKDYYYCGQFFLHRETEEIIELDVPLSLNCVMEDKFYSVSSRQPIFYITNMVTKEVTSFDCMPVLEGVVIGDINSGSFNVSAFTVTKDAVWMAVNGRYLVRINPDTGEIICCETGKMVDAGDGTSELQRDAEMYISRLYTDGIHVYAYYQKNGYFSPGVVVRLNTEEFQSFPYSEVPVILYEELTE